MAGTRSACEVIAVSRKFCKGASTPDLQAAPSLQAGVVARAGAWSRSQGGVRRHSIDQRTRSS